MNQNLERGNTIEVDLLKVNGCSVGLRKKAEDVSWCLLKGEKEIYTTSAYSKVSSLNDFTFYNDLFQTI